MAEITQSRWLFIAVLAGLYVLTCVRVALQAGKGGRSTVRWFFITLIFTAIPAAIVIVRDRRRIKTASCSATIARCRHCGQFLSGELDIETDEMGEKICPHCGMKLDEVHLA